MTRSGTPSPARQARNERRFAEALDAHRLGRLDQAARGYQRVIDSDPRHAHALHHLGLIRHQGGALEVALELLARATRAAPHDASMHNNHANMLREHGQLDAAIDAYRRCVQAEPGHQNGRFNLAMTLLDAGRAAEAVDAFQWFVDRGVDDVAIWNGRGRALVQCRRFDEGVDSFRRAVDARPSEPALHANLIEALLKAFRYEEALDSARAAMRGFPRDIRVQRALGGALLNMTRYAEARSSLVEVLAQTPDDVEARVWLARALTELSRAEEAVTVCDRGLEIVPESPDLVLARGSALLRADRTEEAIADLSRAHDLAPQWVEPLNNLAMAYVDLGRTEEAENLFRQILVKDPRSPEAWYHLARSRSRDAVSDDDVRFLTELTASEDLIPERAVTLHFALAHIFDRRKDYARAFEHYAAGNEARRRFGRYDSRRFRHWVEDFHNVFEPGLIARLSGAGNPSQRPVFVLGMPRSGTTLVEQILASHPQVFGGGEQTFVADLAQSLAPEGADESAYPRVAAELDADTLASLAERYLARMDGIDASAPRITDKMPTNFFHIGLIALMFPNARIVHCVRHPMDVCFSNFIQMFAAGHLYSYSLHDLSVYYREYVRLMAHWKRCFPDRVYDVGYEALLDDQEQVSRALIAHLGLDWDDACLRFHKTERVVRTASHWQVRQPIYHSARQRWRNYAPYLGQLAAGIGFEDSTQ